MTSIGRSICHNFSKKDKEFTHPCSFRSTYINFLEKKTFLEGLYLFNVIAQFCLAAGAVVNTRDTTKVLRKVTIIIITGYSIILAQSTVIRSDNRNLYNTVKYDNNNIKQLCKSYYDMKGCGGI